ncbi:uncharacterized protein LOC142660018 [Rhinoderma darwinii]|uniref:uncharacterized protein LOC142660018 n=1 Tax=Rhinoderma darwinii TaxID=43563 RepID=UPI003F6694CB
MQFPFSNLHHQRNLDDTMKVNLFFSWRLGYKRRNMEHPSSDLPTLPTRCTLQEEELRPSCRQGLRLKTFKNCDVKGKERLMLILHRLSLVVNVLENMNKTDLVMQNLETFSILHSDLMNCEMVKSPELRRCRDHLNQYKETVTKECLQNDVLMSLVWILGEDIGYLIHEEQSGKGTEKKDLHVPAKPPAAKKHKGKRKKKGKKMKKKDEQKYLPGPHVETKRKTVAIATRMQ